jgi:hypothetical protein
MRKERKYHYIYKTTCKVTDKFYVGMHSTDNLEDGYMGSGKRLWRSIRKHGIENHEKEVLEFLPNRSSLKKREKEIVNEKFLENPMCMNLMIGGEGGWSNEQRIKAAAITNSKMWNDPEFIERQRQKMKEVAKRLHKEGKIKPYDWSGRKHSEESKQKMRESAANKTAEKNSQYGTCWITNGTKNKKIKRTDDLPQGWSYGRKSNNKNR